MKPGSVEPAARPAFHRFRRIGDRVVVTGLDGRWVVLSPEDFERFRAGDVAPGTELHRRLSEQGLLAGLVDVRASADMLRRRKAFVGYGPNLHILVVTLRCNQTCVYCHASRAPMDATHTDMTPEVADAVVDMAFRSTSPSITIEFQGGEPLLNFPIVQRVVERALGKAASAGKTVEHTLVTNLTLMDEDKLRWLLDHRVQICTSIDGPAALHDAQRKLPGTSSHEIATRWIRTINERYAAMGLDPTVYHVEALLTTTRRALPLHREVVDTYVDLGCRALMLRPVDPFGFAGRTGDRVGYPVEEFLEFYQAAVDRMIELNRQGVEVLERFAAIFLTKILTGDDPNYLDIRSPCGAAVGQVAYGHDGKVFTCDEGRMLHAEGSDAFLIGDVRTSTYRDLIGHETVRAMMVASNLDGQPDCVHCAYQPYCGTCPVYNLKTQGSLFGRMRDSFLCAVHKGIQDFLFERLGGGDPEVVDVLTRWTTSRPRSHFLQTGRPV